MKTLTSPRVRPLLIGLYLAVVVVLFLYLNIPLTIEWVVLILCIAAALWGRGLLFLRDWGAFILVLFAWQLTAPVATELPFSWHLTELIVADRFLFAGTEPVLWLQQHLYHPGVLGPWDIFAATMYMLHFLAPLLAGFALWLTNRPLFHKYTVAFVLVALAGYVTWIFYPSVPPWMAGEHLLHVGHVYVPAPNGAVHVPSVVRMFRLANEHYYVLAPSGTVYLPGVRDLFNVFVWHWYNTYNGQLTVGFLHGHVDQAGAIPSEHAAFPFLFFLFLRRQFGRPAYLVLLYVAGLAFSVMYLGQHYFVDILAGIAYAAAAYAAAMYAVPALFARLAGIRFSPALSEGRKALTRKEG